MSLGSWMSWTHTLKFFPNLCGFFLETAMAAVNPGFLYFDQFLLVCWWLADSVVSYALTDGKMSGQTIVKEVTFQFQQKRWNCLECFGGISRVKDHRSVRHLPVVCSPWWYRCLRCWIHGDGALGTVGGGSGKGQSPDYFMFSTHTIFLLTKLSPLPL